MEEFIRNITEQIRCVRAREAVAKELSDHILDKGTNLIVNILDFSRDLIKLF